MLEKESQIQSQIPSVDKTDLKVTRDIFTVSNMISMSRMLIPIPMAMIGIPESGKPDTLFTVLVVWAIISDYLDGIMARKLNQISELGKILDPLSDKISAAFLFIMAVWFDRLPLWFFGVMMLRDLLILTGSLVILKTHGKVAMSVMSGKITINVLALLWITVMYFPERETWASFMVILALGMMIYSTGDYFWRYLNIKKGAAFN